MQIFYPDTNIFLGMSNSDTRLLEQAKQKNIYFRCNPIVVWELLSQLEDKYPKAKAALKRIVKLCGEENYLPVPEHQMAIAFGLEKYIPPIFQKARELLPKIVNAAIRSSSPNNIVINKTYIIKNKSLNGWEEIFDIKKHKEFRKEYEQKFSNGADTLAQKFKSNHNWQLPKSLAEAETYSNIKLIENLAVGLGSRCSNLSALKLQELIHTLIPRLQNLEAYIEYYLYIVNQWVRHGRMRDNPYNDLHQLVYLSIENSYFITNDKDTKRIKGFPQRDRLLSWKEAQQRILN